MDLPKNAHSELNDISIIAFLSDSGMWELNTISAGAHVASSDTHFTVVLVIDEAIPLVLNALSTNEKNLAHWVTFAGDRNRDAATPALTGRSYRHPLFRGSKTNSLIALFIQS